MFTTRIDTVSSNTIFENLPVVLSCYERIRFVFYKLKKKNLQRSAGAYFVLPHHIGMLNVEKTESRVLALNVREKDQLLAKPVTRSAPATVRHGSRVHLPLEHLGSPPSLRPAQLPLSQAYSYKCCAPVGKLCMVANATVLEPWVQLLVFKKEESE